MGKLINFNMKELHETWTVLGVDEFEYRSDSELGWDQFIADKVKIVTSSFYPVRVSRFNFGLIVQSSDSQRKIRFHCGITIAEQNDRFYLFLEDCDDYLPQNSCLDLKEVTNPAAIKEIIEIVLKDINLYTNLEETKETYKNCEDFNGVRTFRRLQKFIQKDCPFEQIID